MKRIFPAGVVLAAALLSTFVAHAAPCLMVTLTGTQGGPPAFKGLAGPGTLIRYGEDGNNCSAVKLQFDTGRGTVMRLAELDISPEQLNAAFFTHMHNDHTEGFADLVTLRWMFFGAGRKIDAVCSSDVASTSGFTISCKKFTAHVADSFIQSGEVAQRHSEIEERTAGGPADLINTITRRRTSRKPCGLPVTLKSAQYAQPTWPAMSPIAMDAPAGSVVIGGVPAMMCRCPRSLVGIEQVAGQGRR